MNDKFSKLSEEKQSKILRVALNEFADKGYRGASTDCIVEKAEISKGSLFGYFESKKNLYLYIVQYAVNKEAEYMLHNLNKEKIVDFYDALEKIATLKYQFIMEHDEESRLITFAMNSGVEVTMEHQVQEIYNDFEQEVLNQYLLPYLENMDLREGIQIEDVVGMTYIVLEAIFKQSTIIRQMTVREEKEAFYNERKTQIKKYLSILKYGVCNKANN